MGHDFLIERIGTDGDMAKMLTLIRESDGSVDAFGLGGMDLYLQAVDRRYTIRDAVKIAAAAQMSPLVDGSGLKNTLERLVVQHLQQETDLLRGKKRVLIVSAMDRFGLAESLYEAGCEMVYGDLAFILGLPVRLRSLQTLAGLARLIMPIVRLLPFKMLYPTGKKQEVRKPKYPDYFREADIIAGDFHFIRRYTPEKLPGKVIITNTVTEDDIILLRAQGVKTLITTTPEIKGRSFGTNVMEALLVAYKGSKSELKHEEYLSLLNELDFKPRIVDL
jgi:hypothetical protein